MAQKMVSPNRMELMRLKKELKTARRGHKMLKDKRDELMRQFLELVRENQKLRRIVDQKLALASKGMSLASAVMEPSLLQTALLVGGKEQYAEVSERMLMGVAVPSFTIEREELDASHLPYGLANTTEELDQSVEAMLAALRPMLDLASVEKTVQLLADEIEKTRRRVNSLEYVKIPQLETQIKQISLKMEENERGNLTRLMKVKDMILKRDRLEKAEKERLEVLAMKKALSEE